MKKKRTDKGSKKLRDVALITNNRRKFSKLSDMGKNMMVRRLLIALERPINPETIQNLKDTLGGK